MIEVTLWMRGRELKVQAVASFPRQLAQANSVGFTA